MIQRKISKKVLSYAKQYPVVTITGPRQSGKTTLSRMLFPHMKYFNLENISEREFAKNDPRGFLKTCGNGAVLDEIQRVPELLSYIQTLTDERNKSGQFILTGSQSFELMSSLSQSLAGRTAIVHLLPFSFDEIYKSSSKIAIEDVIYKGFYPRIHSKKLNPTEAYSFYVSTYVEKDLRSILNVKDLSQFEAFLKLCAGRTGQILNLSSIASDIGANHNTVKRWISILEASYIVKLSQPFYKNINKRLIKAPKLYFIDTGLCAFLLGISSPSHITSHPLKGPLFETLVFSEILKSRYNAGRTDSLYFYRDNNGNEVDVILELGGEITCIEIKITETVSSGLFKGLKFFRKHYSEKNSLHLIYGGDEDYQRENIFIHSWKNIPKISL